MKVNIKSRDGKKKITVNIRKRGSGKRINPRNVG